MTRKLAILIISLLMTILPASLSAAKMQRVFSEISNLPGVESTYIGPAALRLAGSYIPFEAGMMGTVGSAIKDLKSIEVVECTNRKSFKEIQKFADELVARLSLEVIVETTEKDETTRIFGVMPEDDGQDSNTLDGLLIEIREKGEYTLVFVRGTIDISKLEVNNDNK